MLSKFYAQQQLLLKRAALQKLYQKYSTVAANVKSLESLNQSYVDTIADEWQHAKPYKQLPGLTKFQLITGFMKGGEFHGKPFDDVLRDCRKRYGDIFKYPGIFGKEDFVMLYKVEDFEKVHRTEGIWPTRPGNDSLKYYRAQRADKFFDEWQGLMGNGEQWSKFRTAVNPILMQPRNAKLYLDSMQAVNDQFIERIRDIRDPLTKEVPDDFVDTINRLTFESVAVVALDKEFGLLRNDILSEEANIFFKNLKIFFKSIYELDVKPSLYKYIKTPTYRRFEQAMDIIFDTSLKCVNEALARIEAEPEGNGKELSVLGKLAKVNRKIAVVMAMDMLTAGVDTTSSVLSALVLHIAKNPENQQKLREEIRAILPNKTDKFTIENMKNMPYLRACIKESLRVRPLLFGNIRKTGMDIVLDGYQIPKDTTVLINSNLFLNEERFYPRAKEFIPERWLRKSGADEPSEKLVADDLNHFIYLPFGFGPRSCVGKRIVDMELEMSLANLVRNFNIEFNYPTEGVFQTHFISVPVKPLKFKFTDLNV